MKNGRRVRSAESYYALHSTDGTTGEEKYRGELKTSGCSRLCSRTRLISYTEDENQQVLFKHINEQILKNARIVEENEKLEAELQHRAESTAPSVNFEDASITSAGVPEVQHQELSEKYDELSKKYQDLSQKVKYLERKNNAVMQKNRDMKESVRAWQQYADRQRPHHKLKGLARTEDLGSTSANLQSDEPIPTMPSSPRSVSTVRTPVQRADLGRSTPAPSMNLVAQDNNVTAAPLGDEGRLPSETITPTGPTVASSNQLATGPDKTHRNRIDLEANAVPSSSQTTVDEWPNQLNRRTQPDDVNDEDDIPQVVSERSLKRKRCQQSRFDVNTGRSSDGTPAKPHRVKEEPTSSPPSAMHVLARTETIDLDDPAEIEAGAAYPLQRTHSNVTGTIRHQRSGSAPFSQVAREQATQREQRVQGRASDVHSKLQIAAAEMRALSEPMNPQLNEQGVLQPLDPNIIAQTSEQTPNKRLRPTEAPRLEYNALAESGEAPPIDENELRLPPSAARARLQKTRTTRDPQTPMSRQQRNAQSGSPLVKQEQSPPSSVETSRRIRATPDSTERRKIASRSRLYPQDDIVPDGRPVWNMRAPERRSTAASRNLALGGKQSLLREKPVNELRVQDFKPNPACNQGYSYAFTEAVRKRGDRMCMPGCTNPQCCGSHFRRLVEALDPLSGAQEEVLLEEYLGDAYNTVMSTQMSSDERTELILQARTKKMAKDAGKHREGYERRRTPPGYWRIDFPSTQEQENDRGRAKEQEVKTVQERWLEAQKAGGRWVFRDE